MIDNHNRGFRQQIQDCFPLIEAIKSAELRTQTVDAFAYALGKSTWSSLSEIPWAVIDGEAISNLVGHINIVSNIAVQNAEVLLAAGHKLDRDIVVSAALLHDVGKILEYGVRDGIVMTNDLVRHSFSGVHIGIAVGLPDAVVHAIALHAWEGELELPASSERSPERRMINARTKEAIVVACADLVALKILRRELAEHQGSAPDLHPGVPLTSEQTE